MIRRYTCCICGVRVRKSRGEAYQCSQCQRWCCGDHAGKAYIDEANAAITKSSPTICLECWQASWRKSA